MGKMQREGWRGAANRAFPQEVVKEGPGQDTDEAVLLTWLRSLLGKSQLLNPACQTWKPERGPSQTSQTNLSTSQASQTPPLSWAEDRWLGRDTYRK